jgi:hypothetical protein
LFQPQKGREQSSRPFCGFFITWVTTWFIILKFQAKPEQHSYFVAGKKVILNNSPWISVNSVTQKAPAG